MALPQHELGVRDLQVSVKFGASAALNAMVRPQDLRSVRQRNDIERFFAGMYGGERLVTVRVPILSQHDVWKPLCETIDERHDLVTLRHRKSSTRAKVILHVDHEKNIAGADRWTCGHRGSPMRLPFHQYLYLTVPGTSRKYGAAKAFLDNS